MKVPVNTKIYETEVQTLWFDDDGILCGRSKDFPRTLQNQRQTYDLIRKISGNKKVCYLSEVTRIQAPDKETREFVVAESSNLFKAVAVISDSFVGRMIANILFNMRRQPYPVKMFSNEDDAKKWLKQFL